MLDDSQDVEKADKEERQSAQNDEDEGEAVKPHAGVAEASLSLIQFVAQKGNYLHISRIQLLIQTVCFGLAIAINELANSFGNLCNKYKTLLYVVQVYKEAMYKQLTVFHITIILFT